MSVDGLNNLEFEVIFIIQMILPTVSLLTDYSIVSVILQTIPLNL